MSCSGTLRHAQGGIEPATLHCQTTALPPEPHRPLKGCCIETEARPLPTDLFWSLAFCGHCLFSKNTHWEQYEEMREGKHTMAECSWEVYWSGSLHFLVSLWTLHLYTFGANYITTCIINEGQIFPFAPGMYCILFTKATAHYAIRELVCLQTAFCERDRSFFVWIKCEM